VPTDIPKEVVHVWLSGNQISRINAVDFAGLHALKYLYLDGNLITSIEAGSFDSLHSLVFLLLNHNALTVIPDGVLSPMVSLEALDLRGNAINSLNARTFQGLTKLVYLNLFANSIATIGCGTFNTVPALGYAQHTQARTHARTHTCTHAHLSRRLCMPPNASPVPSSAHCQHVVTSRKHNTVCNGLHSFIPHRHIKHPHHTQLDAFDQPTHSFAHSIA
jgi:hypothetical protein